MLRLAGRWAAVRHFTFDAQNGAPGNWRWLSMLRRFATAVGVDVKELL